MLSLSFLLLISTDSPVFLGPSAESGPGTAIPVGHESRQDDMPSIAAAPDGTVWVAWLSFDGRRDDVAIRHYKDGTWQNLHWVPGTSGDSWLPQIGVDGANRVWAVWSQQLDSNWDVFARRFDPAESIWGPLLRLSSDPLPDINPRMSSDRRGWLAVAWQGFRRQPDARTQARSHIFLRLLDGDQWTETIRITGGAHNDWAPSPAIDRTGVVWVAYDTYRDRSFDVYLAQVSGNRVVEPNMPVSMTPAFEARATTVVDAEDRVWVAWEFGLRHWGKDNGRALADPGIGSPLGGFREPRIACLTQGRWLEPVSPLEAVFRPYNTYQPHVYSDGSGSIRVVAMEQRTGGPTRDSVLFRKRAYPEYWRGRPDGYWSYWWWYSQKMSDMYHLPGAYVSLFAHERSASYPFGHRNVFCSDRAQAKVVPFFLKDGVSLYAFPLTPEGDEPADEAGFLATNDTELLFEEVGAHGGITIVHTSGSGMGTDWRHRPEPDVEPVVEIFQGARRSFEQVGAPYSWTRAQVEEDVARVRPDTGRISDWIRNLFRIRADGMVSEAWKRGHKLGVIASSDHVSTHISYAILLRSPAAGRQHDRLVVAVFRQLPAGPALRPEGTHKECPYRPGSAQTAFRTPFVKSSSAWSV